MMKTLQEYYEYVEKDTSLLTDINLSSWIVNLHNDLSDDKKKTQCSYEIYFTDYSFSKGELQPQMSYADGETYPNLKMFDDDFKYIISRSKKTKNPRYKAKYNHLLWVSKHKHIDYAKRAIENYYLTIKDAKLKNDDNLSNHAFGSYFKTLLILSQTIDYKKEDVINFFISILGSKKISGFTECYLMKFITEAGKKVDTNVVQAFYDYSDEVINNSIYPEWNGDYLKLILILCQKLKVSSKSYHNKLAEYHISQAEEQKEGIGAQKFYVHALEQYQKAGNKEKIEEVSVLVEKAKKTINLKAVQSEYSSELLQQVWDSIQQATDDLTTNGTSEDILEYIMLDELVFPRAKLLDEGVRPVIFEFISVMTFDINKNVSEKNNNVLNQYHIHIQSFTLQHLMMIFSKGIKSGKLSFQSLVDFLTKKSWYGQDFTYLSSNEEVEGFNWIELLSPSLESFFKQAEIDIKLEKNDHQGYILAMDSLVIKFEGLLREFSRLIGAQTIEIKPSGTEERISFEKLLTNRKLTAIIPEDDIALFKFLFTSEGMNLRNNIAHCFYTTKSYSPGIMFLLIAALLKLGNYKIADRTTSMEESL